MNLIQVKQKIYILNKNYKPMNIIFINESPSRGNNIVHILNSNIFFNDKIKIFCDPIKAINYLFRKKIDIIIISDKLKSFTSNQFFQLIKHKIKKPKCIFYSDTENSIKYIKNIEIIPTYLLINTVYNRILTIKRKEKNPIKLYSVKELQKILDTI